MDRSDFAWLVEHGTELDERYCGKWIAVYQGEVVGVGDTATEAAAQAQQKVPDGGYILEAVDRESDVIYGGL